MRDAKEAEIMPRASIVRNGRRAFARRHSSTCRRGGLSCTT
jgi:hypothetical protein